MDRCRLFCHSQGVYPDELVQVTKQQPFHMSLSIRSVNQCTGFYMAGTSVMKELRRSSPIILRKSFLKRCKADFAFFIFFLSGFYSRFTGHQEKGKAISL